MAKSKVSGQVSKEESAEAPAQAEPLLRRGSFKFPASDIVYEGEFMQTATVPGHNAKDGGDDANAADAKPVLLRHGRGRQTARGEVYDGDWATDEIHGHGLYRFASGAQYLGEFRHNRFHGQGVFTFADGSEYDGEWVENRMHGQGRFKDACGNAWTGRFNNDTFMNESGTWVPVSQLAATDGEGKP